MSFIVSFCLCGVSVKRGKLMGIHSDCPVTTIRLLLVEIYWLSGRGFPIMREAINGLHDDGEWLSKNAKIVRLERKKAAAKARAEMEAAYRADMSRAERRVREYDTKNSDLQNEVYALRRVIKGLQNGAS